MASNIYRVEINGRTRDLGPDWVIPWVHAVADVHGTDLNLDDGAPEETLRLQALQIGHARGWFRYLFTRREP